MENTRAQKQDVEALYQNYLGMTGDAVTRLRLLGFPVDSTKVAEINTIDDFKNIILDIEYHSTDDLKKALKTVYSNYMAVDDLNTFLKMGQNAFSEKEVAEALKIIPINGDGTISVDSLIDYVDN